MMMCKNKIKLLVKDKLMAHLGPLSKSAAAWLVSRNRKVIVQ